MEAIFYTAAALAERGENDIPRELVSTQHLIYSSPATLAFNSPGAEGYGVKRAGLSVPESVMLIVSPGCCGRNTSAISRMKGYEDRFFYLTMNETDLVTGRHLKKIPAAIEEICGGLEERGRRPRVVMICITCVDALLGTDMERICRRAQERVPGVRVQPCYMYALTREGRRPPMVHVRQSIYELLEPRKKKASSVNLMGFFAPLLQDTGAKNTVLQDGPRRQTAATEGCLTEEKKAAGGASDTGHENLQAKNDPPGSELFDILRQAGVKKIRQIGACETYEEFQEMAEANFNLVLHPDVRPAAYDLQERLGMPFIEIRRFYQIDRIAAQYAALGQVLQTKLDDTSWRQEAEEEVRAFHAAYPEAVFSIGEAMNGDPFELACALVREGFAVREIFGTVSKESFVWIRLLAALSPGTRIYSNLHPTMLHYRTEGNESAEQEAEKGEKAEQKVTISIGRDAGWYHPEIPNVQWNTDRQPYGYRAVTGLFRALRQAMEAGTRGTFSADIQLGMSHGDVSPDSLCTMSQEKRPRDSRDTAPRGFRRFTTPFAPDQSGAVSVLYDMGGICIVCDAGGCTGNICGFDEPRWFGRQSAVFSAGLRDMDAILGRDDRLVKKLAEAAQQVPASFASIVGTPVPAVIGTDYRALCRMAEKKTGIPVIGVPTDGMEYYDKGIEKTYLALLEKFCSGEAVSAASDTGRASEAGEAERAPGAVRGDAIPEIPESETASAAGSPRILGIWGYSELDFAGILSPHDLRQWAREQGYDEIICPGAGTGLTHLRSAGRVEKNIVLSPAGTSAAVWLQKRFGTPWSYEIPYAETYFAKMTENISAKKILVVHQHVLADTLAGLLLQAGAEADTAGFFMQIPHTGEKSGRTPGVPYYPLSEEQDLRALAVQGQYDLILADRSLSPILEGLDARWRHLPHFAVSGELP